MDRTRHLRGSLVSTAVFHAVVSSALGFVLWNHIATASTFIGNATISVDTTWDLAGSPYILWVARVAGTDGPDGITTLTIDPGVEVQGGWLKIGDENVNGDPGALVADAGMGAQTIRFTSSAVTPGPGSWCGVLLDFMAHESTVIRNAHFEYGAQPCETIPAQLSDRRPPGAEVTIEDVTFEESGGHDLEVLEGNVLLRNSTLESVYLGDPAHVTFDDDIFVQGGDFLSTVNLASIGSLSHGNTFVPAPGESGRVQVMGGTVDVDATWGSEPGIYLMPFVIVAGTDGADGVTTLNLEPGTRLQFQAASNLRVGEESPSGLPGRLVADAGPNVDQEDLGIVMESSADPPASADWDGIRIETTGSGFFRSTWIRHATTAIRVETGHLEHFANVDIEESTTGLSFIGATLGGTVKRLRSANVDVAVESSGTTPVIRDSILSGSVWGVNNPTPASVVDTRQNWWGAVDGPSGVGPGSGSAVSTGVLFDPWLLSPIVDLPSASLWSMGVFALLLVFTAQGLLRSVVAAR